MVILLERWVLCQFQQQQEPQGYVYMYDPYSTWLLICTYEQLTSKALKWNRFN